MPLLGAWVVLLPQACSKKKTPQDDNLAVSSVDTAAVPVPPVATSGEPVSAFLDAGSAQSPLEQAQSYEASGQHWLARLVLEPKALGADGTKDDLNYLAYLCNQQGDDGCVDKCAAKLGVKKLKFDGGAPKPAAVDVGEHQEPDSDAATARTLFLKRRAKEARAILEPKVIDGTASNDETRLLRTICKEQGDKMCMAVCDSKLK